MAKFINKESCLSCTSKSPIFKFLTTKELTWINNHRYEVVYNPGELIFKQGTACTHVLSFTNGMAKIQLEGIGRGNLILRLVKPVEFITGAGIFYNNEHHYSLSAVTKSRVCFIEKDVFITILDSNKIFCKEFMKQTQQNLIHSFQKLISLNQKHSQGLIAEALLYLSREIYDSNPFKLDLSKIELAELTGMSKEGVFRILKQFNNEKIIIMNKEEIEILNFNILVRISEKG